MCSIGQFGVVVVAAAAVAADADTALCCLVEEAAVPSQLALLNTPIACTAPARAANCELCQWKSRAAARTACFCAQFNARQTPSRHPGRGRLVDTLSELKEGSSACPQIRSQLAHAHQYCAPLALLDRNNTQSCVIGSVCFFPPAPLSLLVSSPQLAAHAPAYLASCGRGGEGKEQLSCTLEVWTSCRFFPRPPPCRSLEANENQGNFYALRGETAIFGPVLKI